MDTGHSAWTHAPTGTKRGRIRKQRVRELTEALSRAPLFSDLPKAHLRKIAGASGRQQFTDGQTLVKEGVSGSGFFVILEGRAQVVRNGKVMKRLGPGDFFGEMAILTGAPRSASVIARGDVACLTVSASGLRAVLKEDPLISLRLLKAMAERLAEADRSLTA